MGSGDVSGSYCAAATAICDVVNRAKAGDLRCSPDPAAGSICNLDALRRGQIDFAMVQSDLQRSAHEGSGLFADAGPMTDLRSVMSLYGETLGILAAKDAGIATVADLRGNRIDPGLPSSGHPASVDRELKMPGFRPAAFAAVAELPAGVAIKPLCSGSIDTTLLIVGHPNAAIAHAIADCGAQLVALTDAEVDAVIRQHPDMRRASLPMLADPELTRDIASVAVTATVVTRAGTDAETVTALAHGTLRNLDLPGRRAPVLAGLNPDDMRKTGLTAPLHPGAKAGFAQRAP